MIATAKEKKRDAASSWHESFLALMPDIIRYARYAFRHMRAETKQDAVQEVIANCLVAFVRLAELDKLDVVYPSVVAQFAIKQYREGRRVGNRWRKRDVYGRNDCHVKHLGTPREQRGGWREQLTYNCVTPIPDQVAFQIDFEAWLQSLSKRDSRIAIELARGERTKDVASHFLISAGRVSQLRLQLNESWHRFHGECDDVSRPSRVAAPDLAAVNRWRASVKRSRNF